MSVLGLRIEGQTTWEEIVTFGDSRYECISRWWKITIVTSNSLRVKIDKRAQSNGRSKKIKIVSKDAYRFVPKTEIVTRDHAFTVFFVLHSGLIGLKTGAL